MTYRGVVAALSTLVLAGCAAWLPARSENPILVRADAQVGAERYEQAVELYDRFLEGHAQDPAAPRVRAVRTALSRLVSAQASIERLRETVTGQERLLGQRQRELEQRQREIDQLKAERERLRADVERLRADVERLRSIDLKEPRR
jgi:septal ring factor EnvC (AmiA/AmiB activator)